MSDPSPSDNTLINLAVGVARVEEALRGVTRTLEALNTTVRSLDEKVDRRHEQNQRDIKELSESKNKDFREQAGESKSLWIKVATIGGTIAGIGTGIAVIIGIIKLLDALAKLGKP